MKKYIGVPPDISKIKIIIQPKKFFKLFFEKIIN